jgi:hypothetical protein
LDTVADLSNEMLIALLDKRVQFESENEGEIIDYLREVMFRKLYLTFGADSMFDFLTRAHFKYSRHIAMNKLDGARVMQSFPYIKEWIQADEINLTQLGMFQTALRQRPATLELQTEILKEIRNQTTENTQFILCEKLGLEIKKSTKVSIQRDDSRRVKMTFSKEQWEIITRAKELLSHSVPSGDLAEVLSYCAKFTSEKKDPAMAATRSRKKSPTKENSNGTSVSSSTDVKQPKESGELVAQKSPSIPITGVSTRQRRKVSRINRRIIFQRHGGCQHRHSDGTYCGSRYQLQIDHVTSLWAGGTNDLENLQILCGVHNREKFRHEVEMDWPPPPLHDQ